MKNSRSTIFFFILFFVTLHSWGQNPGAARGRAGGQNMNVGHFYGKVVDSATNKPIVAASVQLLQNKFDSVSKTRKDVLITGMLTTKKGEFSLENISIMGSYKLLVTAIGYQTI